MSQHPLNLLLRFVLELLALVAMAYWGWSKHEGILRIVLAAGVPLVAAAIWGMFRVSGYPKDAPVEVPGIVRLLIEFAFFATAVVLLLATNQRDAALLFAVVVVLHYLASYDYVLALLRGRRGGTADRH